MNIDIIPIKLPLFLSGLIIFFAVDSLAQTNRDTINFNIPSLEEFAYPYQNLNYVSPRFGQIKNRGGNVQSNYILRTVFTIPDLPIHFRIEVPFTTMNSISDTKRGLSDISFRPVFVFHQKRSWLYGVSLKTILPTGSSSYVGYGTFQFVPDIGFLKVFAKSKGSIGLTAEYQFSVGQNKYKNPSIEILGFSPTLDFWGEKFQIGYYPTYTYNLLTKKWVFPFDVEVGCKLYKSIWLRIEYILPTGSLHSNEYEYLIKLRHDL